MSRLERKKRIDLRLVELGLTKTEVAEQVGLSIAYAISIMNGKVVPSRETAEAIAEVLDLPVDEIFPEDL